MKKLLAVLAAILICISMSSCTSLGRKSSCKNIISDNSDALSEAAQKTLESGEADNSVHFSGVESIEYASPDWVAFITGSRTEDDGSKSYCGFYYSGDNNPKSFRCENDELLTEDGSGFGYGDDSYYTELIQYGWYYYEAYGME